MEFNFRLSLLFPLYLFLLQCVTSKESNHVFVEGYNARETRSSPHQTLSLLQGVKHTYRPPRLRFTKALHNVRVWENVKTPTPILQLKVNDKDSLVNYTIIRGHTDFQIDQRTSKLHVNSPPDAGVYKLYICANTEGEKCAASTLVKVKVLQREKRMAENLSFVFVLPLNATGEVFGLSAQENVPEKDVTFAFTETVLGLEVHPTTGMVKVVRADWHQEQTQITLNFTVKSNDGSEQAITAVVHRVERGSHSPLFTNEPTPVQCVIPGVPVGGAMWVRPHTDLITLQAIDAVTHGARLHYRLETGGNGRFTIDQDTGIVTTQGRASYPLDGVFDLAVSANIVGVVYGATPHTQVVRVKSDNLGPQFYQEQYVVNLDEFDSSSAPNTDNPVVEIKAFSFYDLDINFDLTSDKDPDGNDFSAYFKLDKKARSGSITSGTILPLGQSMNLLKDPRQYRYNITATEVNSGLSTTVQLIINLIDINDNEPFFLSSYYTRYDLTENTAIGTTLLTVRAMDKDEGDNAILDFDVENEDFEIEMTTNYTGELVVKRTPSSNNQPGRRYVFNITATDRGTPPQQGFATVHLRMINSNTQSPVFEPPKQVAYMREQLAQDQLVHVVQAYDPDGHTISPFKYKINNNYGLFKIDENSGAISLIKRFESGDKRETFIVEVELSDGVNPVTADNVTIYTMGINRPPRFTNCKDLNPTVAEGQPVGTSVVPLTAIDPDSGASGEMVFDVVGSQTGNTVFDIVDNGNGAAILTTKVILDREDPSDVKPNYFERIGNSIKYSVTVQVQDKHPKKPLLSYCSFLVTVTDINDQIPEFDMNSNEIREFEPVIPMEPDPRTDKLFRAFALDRDEGENAKVVYGLRNIDCEGCFEVDADTGYITAAKDLGSVLDPANLEVTVEVNARDYPRRDDPVGDHISYLNITFTRTDAAILQWGLIEGSDVDDYVIKVKENVKGPVDPVLKVTNLTNLNWFAVAGRFEENNFQKVFKERLAAVDTCDDGKGCAKLDKNYIDPPYPLRYVRMIARGGATGQRTGAIKRIKVEFLPQNLRRPVFAGQNSLRTIPAFVSTETVSGDAVAQIFAYDTDSSSKYNTVSYMFEADCTACNRFNLKADTGEITATDTFISDRDPIDLTAYARDNTASNIECTDDIVDDCYRRSDTQRIGIEIAQPLAGSPEFQQKSSTIDVDEGFYPPRKNILKLNSTMDGEESVQHAIVSGNVEHIFAIDARGGQLYQKGELDFSTTKQYELSIGVFYGEQKDTAKVMINVKERPCLRLHTFTNTAGGLPEFTKTGIVEHSATPSLVAQLGAPGAGITYQLTGPLQHGFKLQGNEVHTSGPLDRDFPDGYDVWQVNIEAVCEGRKDDDPRTFAIANLRLTDRNDNSPVIDTRTTQGHVSEGLGTEVEVMQVVATDYDDGANAVIIYSITQGGDDFWIESGTGIVKTKRTFSRTQETSVEITVMAKDSGPTDEGSKPVQQFVTIDIDDIDDNSPIFEGDKTYTVSIPENQAVGASVISVFADDKDFGENARRIYNVQVQSGNHFFADSIVATGHGVVKIKETIDYEALDQQKSFTIKVKVTGPAPNSFADEATVTIGVTDVNDNVPLVCPKGTLSDVCPVTPPTSCQQNTRAVVENSPLEHLIMEIEGCDRDTGTNAEFDYFIDYEYTDVEKKFKVAKTSGTKNNGVIRLRSLLDRETQSQYTLHILAIDKGTPALTGTSTLTISVTDVNDNAPEFEDPMTWRVVPAATQTNVLVGQWKVIDKDTEENGPPFKIELDDTMANNKVFLENFSWTVKGDVIEVQTKKTAYKRTATLKRFTATFALSDKHGVKADRELNIEIQDVNDHPHSAGQKAVTVYSYRGMSTDIWLGHVFAEDVDDWDRTEKTYSVSAEGFKLDTPNSWDLTMNLGVNPTKHALKVSVSDAKYGTGVSDVDVDVLFIYEDALDNIGSIRLEGITPEGLVEITNRGGQSKLDLLKTEIAKAVGATNKNFVHILNIHRADNADITSTDVYYNVKNSKENYLRPARIDGNVWINKGQIETALGTSPKIIIKMAPINDCFKTKCWQGSCVNRQLGSLEPITVNTNRTSHVGLNVSHQATCACDSASFPPTPERCSENICLNGGTCEETWTDVICTCPKGFEGPRCQQMKLSFQNPGVAWYEPLSPCNDDVIRFQFATKAGGQQVLLYNGPIHTCVSASSCEPPVHLAVQLDASSQPWMSVDMGAGAQTVSLTKGKSLNDGMWHTVEITKEGREFRMTIDYCIDSTTTDNSQTEDRSNCEVSVVALGDDLVFAPTAPLQLGGVRSNGGLPEGLGSQGLIGCMKDVFSNGKYYDLHVGDVGYGINATDGCPAESTSVSSYATTRHYENETCVGDLNGGSAQCRCTNQRTGFNCSDDTIIRDYKTKDAYLEWDMAAGASNNREDYLQISFRTRQPHGRIFFAQSEKTLERIFLEIIDSRLSFTFDLGTGDNVVSLPELNVSEGAWHTAYIYHRGNRVILEVDGGEGRYHGEKESKGSLPNLDLSGKQYCGGANVKFRRYHTEPIVTNSMQFSQLTDIRLSAAPYPDQRLALTEAENANSAGQLQADAPGKVEIGPVPDDPCSLNCGESQTCVDAWRYYFCSCLANQTDTNGVCTARNDCSVKDCGPAGVCVPQPDGSGVCFYGTPIAYDAAKASLAASALGIIIGCLILMLLLLLLSTIAQGAKKPPETAYLLDPELENHTRENVIEYCEEGPGEELPVKSDLPAMLRLPLVGAYSNGPEPYGKEEEMPVRGAPQAYAMRTPSDRTSPSMTPYSPDVVSLIMQNKEVVDEDPACNASDYYLQFEHEGSASLATSLSSLQSSNTGDQSYDYLNQFGPRFQKLADMYGDSDEESNDPTSYGFADTEPETLPFTGNDYYSDYDNRGREETPGDHSGPAFPDGPSRGDGYIGGYGDDRSPPHDTTRFPSDYYTNKYSPESSGFSDPEPASITNNIQGVRNGYDNLAFADPARDETGYRGSLDGETLVKRGVGNGRPGYYGSGTFTPSAFHVPSSKGRENGFARHSFAGVPENDISDV